MNAMPDERQRWTASPSELVTEAVMRAIQDDDWVRSFRQKIDTRSAGQDDCDIWTAGLSSEGYGVVRVGSHVVRAHRVAFMLAFGPVPADRPVLDHVYPMCRYRFCVNEFHLEPVTEETNKARRHGTGRAVQRQLRAEALAARDHAQRWAA